MTNVDACERDPERAFAVNALGVRTPRRRRGTRRGAHVVHISTDYVFDGDSAPARTTSGTRSRPLSEYGRSKLGGERRARGARGSWATVRTSWVFGKRGTDLVSWAFGAFERGELDGVLADQVSIPTYAPDLAELLARFAVERRQGLFHVTSGSEAVTRHELIVDRAARPRARPERGRADRRADLDRPAARPLISALDNRALRLAGLPGLRPWRDARHRVREGLVDDREHPRRA